MIYSQDEIRELMKNKRYPLSARYDSDWIIQNSMGSHSLWLLEALIQDMSLKNDMRILDLGCGKAIGSIFLATEIGASIWAVDRMKNVTENYRE